MPRLENSSCGSAAGSRTPHPLAAVLGAALRLVDEEGLGALTRRRLGQELGSGAMTLYRYAPDRAALLDGIVELVLDELVTPDDRLDWQTNCGAAHTTSANWPSRTRIRPGATVTRPMSRPFRWLVVH